MWLYWGYRDCSYFPQALVLAFDCAPRPNDNPVTGAFFIWLKGKRILAVSAHVVVAIKCSNCADLPASRARNSSSPTNCATCALGP